MKIDQPGIYVDFDPAAYHADPCPKPSFTQSIAKVILDRSPAHARLEHPRLAPVVEGEEEAEKYVAAQAIGNAAHALMIGRGRVVAEGKFDDWRSKAAQAFRLEQHAAGKIVILTKHLRRAEDMVAEGRVQLARVGWKSAFDQGAGEVVIAWQEHGLWFRSMIDWMTSSVELYDYKTSGKSTAPHTIPLLGIDAGWDIQAAMHERGLDVLDPENAGRRKFRFVAQENEPPYALTPVELTEAWLTMGRKKLQRAIDVWRDCLTRNRWPAYPAVPLRPEYPEWQERKWLEREETTAFHENVQALAEGRRAPAEILLPGG